MTILLAILVFSLLVVIHELGHFLVAKKMGVLVEEFSVGMGPAIVSRKRGETRYSWRWIPMGGYCAMQSEPKEGLRGRSFNEKSVPRRMAIIAAGPAMNLVLAFVIMFGLLGYSGFLLPQVKTLLDGYSAQQAGMQPGDRILSIDGQRVGVYEDLGLILGNYDGKGSVPVVVSRNGKKLSLSVTPQLSETGDRYLLGFSPAGRTGLYGETAEGYDRATLGETFQMTAETIVYQVRSTAVGLFRVITLQASRDEVTGPVGIVEVIGDSYEAGLQYSPLVALANVLYLMALLSDNLALVNLIPIPGLDGGRLFFLIIEGIRRKAIPVEKENIIHLIGLGIVFAFMALVLYNDIAKLFT